MSEIMLSISEESLSALHVPAEQAAYELRMLAAVKLFEMQRLSADAAARLAGVSRVVFFQRLRDYGIAILDLPEEEQGQETRPATAEHFLRREGNLLVYDGALPAMFPDTLAEVRLERLGRSVEGGAL